MNVDLEVNVLNDDTYSCFHKTEKAGF